jgi:hypothetical protein
MLGSVEEEGNGEEGRELVWKGPDKAVDKGVKMGPPTNASWDLRHSLSTRWGRTQPTQPHWKWKVTTIVSTF